MVESRVADVFMAHAGSSAQPFLVQARAAVPAVRRIAASSLRSFRNKPRSKTPRSTRPSGDRIDLEPRPRIQRPSSSLSNRTLPKVIFEFMRADGAGKPICYFRMDLRNVLIAGVAPSIEPGALLGEHISLKYSEMLWKYTKQLTAGGGSTVGGWDCAANKVAT